MTSIKTSTIASKKVSLCSTKAETVTDRNSTDEEDQFSLKNLQHPAIKCIHGTNVPRKEFLRFAANMYRALEYCTNSLRGPSQDFIKQKKINLPSLQDSKQKLLLMDLDETLIHALGVGKSGGDVELKINGERRAINIRPFCREFLSNMSTLYNVYVFTAGTLDYATPIVQYLNKDRKTILGILHRDNCLTTSHNFQIKDLRVIQNRQLSDIILVDNFVHSFGLQLDNGIPILEFRHNKQDAELKGLQSILAKASKEKDVRKFISQTFGLRKMLQRTEKQFLKLGI